MMIVLAKPMLGIMVVSIPVHPGLTEQEVD
jgi:hypothetical protein